MLYGSLHAKKNWIPPFGYEVIEEMIKGTTQVLLKSPIDETQEWFRTTTEKFLKIDMELSKNTQEKNVKKVVQESMAKANLTEGEVNEYKCFKRLAASSGASAK